MKNTIIKLQVLLLVILLSSCQFINNQGVNNKLDVKMRLHDIWALEAVNSENINIKSYNKHPNLEINLTTNKVMGNDGCNNFSGVIKLLDNNNLSFINIVSTRMACPNMKFYNKIGKYLGETKSYKLENLRVLLYDTEGSELLRFKKVD